MSNKWSDVSHDARRYAQVIIPLLLVLGFAVSATPTVARLPQPPSTPSAMINAASQTNTPTLQRTNTPTQSAPLRSNSRSGLTSGFAPAIVPGQPQVDANTIALYHFDAPNGNLAIDATGNYTGTLFGDATIDTSGLYNGVLHLHGNGGVQIPYSGDLSQGTIEAYVDFGAGCPASNNIPLMTFYNTNGTMVAQWIWGGVIFGILTPTRWQWANTGVNACKYLTGSAMLPWPYDTWRFHHLAATWGPRGMEIWLDGMLNAIGEQTINVNPGNPFDPVPYFSPYEPFYMCNPQDRTLLNPPCPNLLSGPVPYSHVGGILPFSSVMIGGSSSARIDEVRISNVQRQFSPSVVPTPTPLPTQTPSSFSGENSVDSTTLALYHMNSSNPNPLVSLFNEVSGVWDPYLEGQAKIQSGGRFGAGLWLDGITNDVGKSSEFRTPSSSIGNPPFNGTVDLWVLYTSQSSQATIFAADSLGGNLALLGVHPPYGNLAFGLWDGSGWQFSESNVSVGRMFGSWHHVAGTWGGRGLEIWFDGQLCNRSNYAGAIYGFPTTYHAGCDAQGHCMQGTIDELRISNAQRTFVPISGPSPARAFSRPSAPSVRAAQSDSFVFLPLVGIQPTPIYVPFMCGPLGQ